MQNTPALVPFNLPDSASTKDKTFTSFAWC